MKDLRKQFGNEGELYASEYLSKKGLQVVSKQYKTPFGEIDLVCLDGNEVVFVEVKSRKNQVFGYPEDSVTVGKMQHLLHSADYILEKEHWLNQPWRVDVVSLEYGESDPVVSHFIGIDIPDDFC